MRTEYNSKTLGPKSSTLLVELNEQGKTTFSLRDVEEITGLRGSSARTLIHKAERRGLLTRLRSGLYTLIPFEMGRTTEYVGVIWTAKAADILEKVKRARAVLNLQSA